LRYFAEAHPNAATAIARSIFLIPGYMIELGFYFLVLVIFLYPSFRNRAQLTPAQRALVLLAVATIPVTSFIRSGVLSVNDFGIHSALFLQFPLLLLASELVLSWRFEEHGIKNPSLSMGLPHTPSWLRSVAGLAIVIGLIGTGYRVLVMRFTLPIAEAQADVTHDPRVAELSHKAYISYIGYAHLAASIPRDAVVQFNPTDPWIFWKNVDMANVDHQVAIAAGTLWCGSELGGDPAGCPVMSSAIDPLFEDALPDQARSVCHAYGIHYLVANIYDSVWKDEHSWVWGLRPVVSDPEFRALDCR
jgi:hypothetical protein